MNKTFLHRGIATLAAGIDADDVTATLVAGDSGVLDAAATRNINAVIWNSSDYPEGPQADPDAEDVLITAASGTAISAMTRAQEGSSAAAHNTSGKTYKLMYGHAAKSDMDFIRLSLPTSYAGDPNGNVDGQPGRTCRDSVSGNLYLKSSAAGTLTGWV